MKLALTLLLAMAPIAHAGIDFELEPNVLIVSGIYLSPQPLKSADEKSEAATLVSSGSAKLQGLLAIASRHGVRAVTNGPAAHLEMEPILFPGTTKLDLLAEVTWDGSKFTKESSAPVESPIFAGALDRDGKTTFAFLHPAIEETAAPAKFERNLQTVVLSCEMFEVPKETAAALLMPQRGVIDVAQILEDLRARVEKGTAVFSSISGVKAPNGQNTLKAEGANSLRIEPVISPDGQLIDINLHLTAGKSELMTTARIKYGHTSFLGTLRPGEKDRVILAFLNTAK